MRRRPRILRVLHPLDTDPLDLDHVSDRIISGWSRPHQPRSSAATPTCSPGHDTLDRSGAACCSRWWPRCPAWEDRPAAMRSRPLASTPNPTPGTASAPRTAAALRAAAAAPRPRASGRRSPPRHHPGAARADPPARASARPPAVIRGSPARLRPARRPAPRPCASPRLPGLRRPGPSSLRRLPATSVRDRGRGSTGPRDPDARPELERHPAQRTIIACRRDRATSEIPCRPEQENRALGPPASSALAPRACRAQPEWNPCVSAVHSP